VVNGSKRAIEGVLFQLKRVAAGIEAAGTGNHRMVECLILFISCQLTNIETRYWNSAREALEVI